VPSNNVAIGARQSRERAQCIAIQFIGADAGGNRRLIAVRRDVLVRRGVGLVRSVLPAVVTEVASAIIALLEPTAAIVTTLITATIPTTIIATTEITAIIIATLEVTTIPIATVIAETTATIIITTLEVATAIITLLEPTATAVLETTASVITTLITATIPTTIIATAEITAIIIATLEVATLTIAETTTTIIITTLEVATLTAVGTFAVTVTPLRLALLVSTTAKFAASSSLFCHGVYPLFLRRLALLSAVRNARSTTQY